MGLSSNKIINRQENCTYHDGFQEASTGKFCDLIAWDKTRCNKSLWHCMSVKSLSYLFALMLNYSTGTGMHEVLDFTESLSTSNQQQTIYFVNFLLLHSNCWFHLCLPFLFIVTTFRLFTIALVDLQVDHQGVFVMLIGLVMALPT